MTLRRLTSHLLPLGLALALAGCGGGKRSRSTGAAPGGSLSGVTVILDPGHGGNDSGAIRAGVREDVINYRMASTVAAELRARGATVVFTVRSAAIVGDLKPGQTEPPLMRPADSCLALTGQPIRLRRDSAPDDLYSRPAITRTIWRDLPAPLRATGRGLYFLSLHCDELGSPRGRGARVYFDKREKRPSRFALLLKTRLTAAGFTNSGSGMVIPRRYGVLNPEYNPVPERALLEMATLSNPKDRAFVRNAAWRWRLARLIATAIGDCDKQELPDSGAGRTAMQTKRQ